MSKSPRLIERRTMTSFSTAAIVGTVAIGLASNLGAENAQSPAPAFEVASVKATEPGNRVGGALMMLPERLVVRNQTLHALIATRLPDGNVPHRGWPNVDNV
jgi:hypothetical protein